MKLNHVIGSVAAAAVALVSTAALAAEARPLVGPVPPVGPPARLADVVITGAGAARAMDRSLLRLDVAERIAKVCLDRARRNEATATVQIIDQFGNLIYGARLDGQHAVNIETALMKAKTALYLRQPSHATMNASIENMMNELRMMQLGMFPNTGGLPILVEGQLLGAIGVGGWGGQDQACAYEGLQTVLGPQPPLPPDLPRRPR